MTFLTVMGRVSNTKATDTTTRVRVVAEAFFRLASTCWADPAVVSVFLAALRDLARVKISTPLLRTRKENGSREKRNMSISTQKSFMKLS